MELSGTERIMLKNAASISMPKLLLLLALVYCGGCQMAPRKPDVIPPGDYAYVKEYADHRIRHSIKRHHLPSVAVALIDDQDTVWQGTFGWANLEEKIPAEPDTVYKLWSVAKAFTAIETMRLVEEGRVDLDAPVTAYIPDFSIQSRFADSEPITIRTILTHRSGLPRNSCFPTVPGAGDDTLLGKMARSMKDGYLAYPVGTRYKYSNVGLDILGQIIQESRGKSYAFYMQEDLLGRIGMKDSSYLFPPQKTVALGYEYYKRKYYPYQQGDINALPSGNLYSTIEDMGTFVKFMFRDGQAGGEQIIQPETLEQMYENQFSSKTDPQPMGLGLKIAGAVGSELMMWHDGGPSDGTGALVAMLPERKLGVVILSNSTGFGSNISVPLAANILERMLETKYGIVLPKDEAPAEITIDRWRLQDYAGTYIAFGKVMEVSPKGNRLKGKIEGIALDLIPVGQTTFKVSHWLDRLGLAGLFNLPIDLGELEIEFLEGDASGDDVMIINIGNISYEICPRYPEMEEIPPLWNTVAGQYELMKRPLGDSDNTEVLGHAEIWIDDGVLQMGGVAGPLLPISDTEIIIQGGPFAGETMAYEPATGNLYHHFLLYKPIRPESDTTRR
ncbi:MAG: serine hydrolase domain-containing protein [Planctomycetota bacterium]|jgi:CubicO group peptidase (beta-lactamase class C family)